MNEYAARAINPEPTQRADALMEKAAKTFQARNAVYGSTYRSHGEMMKVLFPNGVKLESVSDFNRFCVMDQIVVKLIRYANNFKKGGHHDSVHDLGVYAFILEELDGPS